MNATPIITYSGVAWQQPGREAPLFSGLDLSVGPGQVAVIMSGLGGGKSSALRLALGLERPSLGEVRVCGGEPAAMRERIGYVGGEGALLANLTLRDNLVLPLRFLRNPPADEVELRARAALALFGVTDPLPPLAPAYAPTNLRRLVALARAMILDPVALVLDDPADDFDPDSALEVWEHLADLATVRGIAVLTSASAPPPIEAAICVSLHSAGAHATRRFTADQRRTALVPALRAKPISL